MDESWSVRYAEQPDEVAECVTTYIRAVDGSGRCFEVKRIAPVQAGETYQYLTLEIMSDGKLVLRDVVYSYQELNILAHCQIYLINEGK